jgi:hypothetical protein
MRQTIKFLHTFSSCGLVGGLAIYMLVLLKGPQANAAQFADMRAIIVVICDFVIVPSLGISLVTGLLAMMVHRPYQEKRWAWAKALMGFAMFESTLAITQSKAGMAATLSARALEGANIAEDLAGLGMDGALGHYRSVSRPDRFRHLAPKARFQQTPGPKSAIAGRLTPAPP